MLKSVTNFVVRMMLILMPLSRLIVFTLGGVFASVAYSQLNGIFCRCVLVLLLI